MVLLIKPNRSAKSCYFVFIFAILFAFSGLNYEIPNLSASQTKKVKRESPDLSPPLNELIVENRLFEKVSLEEVLSWIHEKTNVAFAFHEMHFMDQDVKILSKKRITVKAKKGGTYMNIIREIESQIDVQFDRFDDYFIWIVRKKKQSK